MAQTTADLRDEWNALRRDLQENGYAVVPDQSLPLIAGEVAPFMEEHLTQSQMSIHLVGADYGLVPEGTQQSIVELQNQEAAQRSQETGLARLIWLPTGLQAADERQGGDPPVRWMVNWLGARTAELCTCFLLVCPLL